MARTVSTLSLVILIAIASPVLAEEVRSGPDVAQEKQAPPPPKRDCEKRDQGVGS
jgi:hypothetical protein